MGFFDKLFGKPKQVRKSLLLAFHVVGDRESPDEILAALRSVAQVRTQLSKVFFTHGEAIFNLAGLLEQPSWAKVFEYCQRNQVTLVMDPDDFLTSRTISSLVAYSLANAVMSQTDVHVVQSIANRDASFSGLSKEQIDIFVQTKIGGPTSQDVAVDPKRKILLCRNATIKSRTDLFASLPANTFAEFLTKVEEML